MKAAERAVMNSEVTNMVNRIMGDAEFEIRTVFGNTVVVAMRLKFGVVFTESFTFMSDDEFDRDTGVDECVARLRTRVWENEMYRRMLSANEK